MRQILPLRLVLIVVSVLALTIGASEAATKRKTNSGTQNQAAKSAAAKSSVRRSSDPNSGPPDPSIYRYDPVGKD